MSESGTIFVNSGMATIPKLYLCILLSWFAQIVNIHADNHSPAEGDSILYLDSSYLLLQGWSQDVYEACTFLFDTTGLLTIDQVMNREQDFKKVPFREFNKWSKPRLAINGTWVKLILRSNTDLELFLGIARDEIKYFLKYADETDIYSQGISGTHSYNGNPFLNLISTPVIPVKIQKNRPSFLYARLTPKRWCYTGHNQLLRNNFRLLNKAGLYESYIITLSGNVPHLAIILTIFLYHLVLFFYNRVISYLWLSLSALSFAILILHNSDLLINWFTDPQSWPFV